MDVDELAEQLENIIEAQADQANSWGAKEDIFFRLNSTQVQGNVLHICTQHGTFQITIEKVSDEGKSDEC